MNWDCSLIMRASVNEEQPVIHKFPRHKIKHSCGNMQPCDPSSSKEKKVSLKRHATQQQKSKQLKKKTSLKSRNYSPISKNSYAQPQTQFQSRYHNTITSGFVSPPHYIQTSRTPVNLQTENSQSSSNIYYTQATYARNTPKQCNLFQKYRMPPRGNVGPPTSSFPKKAVINCTPVFSSHYSQNQKTIVNQIQKVAQITTNNKTFGTTNYGCKPGQIIIKELKKAKIDIKVAKFPVADSPNLRFQYSNSIKNLSKTNISQKKYEKQDKENIINRINPPKQFCVYDDKLKTQQQDTKASNLLQVPKKKKRIEDFLTSRQQIKSIRDSDEWSENQQNSEIITTFRDIIQAHGKFHIEQ